MNDGVDGQATSRLVEVLVEARDLGFLGPGPVEAHLGHAAGFARALGDAGGVHRGVGARSVLGVDLGSGGGVPGLPLAVCLPAWRWILVDAARRRARFLREAVERLGIDERVQVLEERAEAVGRGSDLRGTADAVVARSFGAPAVVAECAAPLLAVGGHAVVSEPPDPAPARWSTEGLLLLGMTLGPLVPAGGASFQVLVQAELCGPRFPRRVGVPAKRPLF